MKTTQRAADSQAADLFTALGLERRSYRLSERQLYVELHPRAGGSLGRLAKNPVLSAQALVAVVEPDSFSPGGARIEVTVDVDGIAVISPEISDGDKEKIQRRMRAELLESEIFPLILFVSRDVSVSADGSSVLMKGSLTIHGQATEHYLRFKKTKAGAYEAAFEISQSAFGLTPLTALMGAIKSEDRLDVRCVVYLGTR